MPALPEEEQAIVAVVRELVDRDVRPVARELEHANSYPAQLIERMKQLGVFGLVVPAPYGAVRVSTRCFALVTEELARGWMSLAGAVGGHSVVASLIATFGTERQRERYLPRMATGQLRATMALTEPGGGSDLQAIRTVARRDDARQAGQDSAGYVVNGTKTWITTARRGGLGPPANPPGAPRRRARQARQDRAGYLGNGNKTWITNARRAGLVALLC